MIGKKTKRILSLALAVSLIGGYRCAGLNKPIGTDIADQVSVEGETNNIPLHLEDDELNKDISTQGIESNLESELEIHNQTTDSAVKGSAVEEIKENLEECEFNEETSKKEIEGIIKDQLEIHNQTTDCAVRLNTEVGKEHDGFEKFYNDFKMQQISLKVALIDEEKNNSTVEISKAYSIDEKNADDDLLKYFEIIDDKKGGVIITKYTGKNDIYAIPEKIGGKDVTGIDSEAFKGCKTVKTLKIPKTVKSIGTRAFEGCKALTDIYISDDISMQAYAFLNCTGLKNVEFSKDKKELNITIGNYAFSDCKNLKYIKNQDCIGKVSIGGYAFRACSSLEDISMTSKATNIGMGAFYNCSNLTGDKDRNGVLTIPDCIETIGTGVFYGCSSLSKVEIKGANKIGDNAFSKCKSLSEIDLSNVNEIGNSAFESCGLINIKLSDGIKKINDSTFRGCSKLTEVKIPKGNNISDIYDYAFSGCTKLNSIDISNIPNIGDYSFYGCRELKDIDISKAKKIGDGAFRGCSKLTKIDISNVDSIGNDVFSLCSGLTSVTIPDSVESIGEYAFYGCDKLTSIDIPKATSIKGLAFCECSNLNSITLPEGTTEIGMGEFYECSNLSKLEIPETVQSIGTYAFYGCDALETVIIPENISTSHKELEKLNPECEIVYKTNEQGHAVITEIKTKTDSSKVVIPEKIYDKPVDISNEIVDKIKDSDNEVETQDGDIKAENPVARVDGVKFLKLTKEYETNGQLKVAHFPERLDDRKKQGTVKISDIHDDILMDMNITNEAVPKDAHSFQKLGGWLPLPEKKPHDYNTINPWGQIFLIDGEECPENTFIEIKNLALTCYMKDKDGNSSWKVINVPNSIGGAFYPANYKLAETPELSASKYMNFNVDSVTINMPGNIIDEPNHIRCFHFWTNGVNVEDYVKNYGDIEYVIVSCEVRLSSKNEDMNGKQHKFVFDVGADCKKYDSEGKLISTYAQEVVGGRFKIVTDKYRRVYATNAPYYEYLDKASEDQIDTLLYGVSN